MKKYALIAARRKNIQRREGASFFASLSELGVNYGDFVDARFSVDTEELMETILCGECKHINVRRTSELSWDEVSESLSKIQPRSQNEKIIVYFCHYRDMAFYADETDIIINLHRVLMWDKDSVYACAVDGMSGFGVDMYISEISGQTRFTLDLWGLYDDIVHPADC